MSKLYNLYRQFGFYYLIKSFFRKVFRHLFIIESYYVLSRSSDEGLSCTKNTNIELVDKKRLESFLRLNVVDAKLQDQLRTFIENGDCYALIALDGRNVAGWGYVQSSGAYTYGRSCYQLPAGFRLLKNLYVYPQFRGGSVGKEINAARTKSIPSGQTGIVFVLRDNRYAIRNLEMFGYQKSLKLTEWFVFERFHFRQIKRIGSKSEFAILIKGFTDHE